MIYPFPLSSFYVQLTDSRSFIPVVYNGSQLHGTEPHILGHGRRRHGRFESQGPLGWLLVVCSAEFVFYAQISPLDQQVPSEEEGLGHGPVALHSLIDPESGRELPGFDIDTEIPATRPKRKHARNCCVCCGVQYVLR